MEPWEAQTWQPTERQTVHAVPLPLADWAGLAKAWDTYEYCCIMEALILGKRVVLWRAN